MKKIIFLSLLLSTTLCLKAQIPSFTIGPKVGYSSNTFSINVDSITNGLKTSFQFGAFARFGDKVYFQPEVYYTVKGGILDDDMGVSVYRQNLTLKTLVIPVIVGAKIVSIGGFNARIMGGPTMSFIIDKKIEPPYFDGVWPVKSTDDLRNSILGVQMGGGIDVLFMSLDVRYELGLNNLYKGSTDFSIKNNAVNISLGIKLL